MHRWFCWTLEFIGNNKRTSCFCWTTKEKFKADHKFKIKAENKIQVAYDPHATSDKWFKELHHAYGVSFFEKLFKYLG